LALSSIIKEQKRTNYRLDTEEALRAQEKLKKLDNGDRKVTLMTTYLSQKQDFNREDYVLEEVRG